MQNTIKLKSPHQMIVGSKYKIIEPNYDDYNEGLEPIIEYVEVVKKMKNDFLLRSLINNIEYVKDFRSLMECDIEEYHIF